MSEHPNRLVAAGISAGLLIGAVASNMDYTPDQRQMRTEMNAAEENIAHVLEAATDAAALTDTLSSEGVHRLLGRQAGINIIYMTNSHLSEQAYAKPYIAKMHQEFRTKLLASDRKILGNFAVAFEEATYGRYVPESVEVTKADPISLPNNCFAESNIFDQDKVEAEAEPYIKKDKINIVALDSAQCTEKNTPVGGYARHGYVPVITQSTFYDYKQAGNAFYAETAVHETGHEGGLAHAGKAVCKHAVELEDCTVAPADDQNSIMSYMRSTYTRESFRFSAPELYILGLLKPHEVAINPGPGVIELSPLGLEGKKLIVANDLNNNPAYISYTYDQFAGYKDVCVPETQAALNHAALGSQLRTEGTKSYLCAKEKVNNMVGSVQVRFPRREIDSIMHEGVAGKASLAMVDVKTDSNLSNDPRLDAYVADGYTRSETILERDGITYRFAGMNSPENAVIEISK